MATVTRPGHGMALAQPATVSATSDDSRLAP
jgi:hypothetical protein